MSGAWGCGWVLDGGCLLEGCCGCGLFVVGGLGWEMFSFVGIVKDGRQITHFLFLLLGIRGKP